MAVQQSHNLWWHAWRKLRASKSALLGMVIVVFMLFVGAVGSVAAPHDYREQLEPLLEPPNGAEWFGRDSLGRDIFSRILVGARLTLGAGVATVCFGLLIGLPLGLVSGYFRGKTDQVIMRSTDMMLAMPDYLLALAIVAVLQPSLTNAMLAVGLSFVPKFARVVRAAALMEGDREYVSAARALGATHLRVMFLHVLPNCLPPILVLGTISLGSAILFTSALSFLGLGAQPPLPEWGAMLNEGVVSFKRAPHVVIFPGAAIALTVFGVNLLGDGMRDALDVRLQ